ncbi:sensor histidine kinase [Microbacterium halophytorum]|uniref:sensor histidine kinase n=1 Tax=Microbacterium halophytorum TaxID=2067568 RepID=UPI00131A1219|nr:histidine kinase [Microbacterium halophytorum]
MTNVSAMDARIERAWRAPAAPGATGPRVRDGVIALIAAVAAIAEAALRTDLVWPAASAAITIAVLPGLLWRRAHPLAVVAGMTAVSAAAEIAAFSAGAPFGALGAVVVMLAVPYALFRWGTGRARIVGAPVLAAGILVSLVTGGDGAVGAAAGALIVGGACLVGVIRRQRVEAQAARREYERTAEREELARDLHDTVAHHVSAIAIRAQAAQALPPDAGHAPTAFAAIEREARDALAEMRSLVRTLRGGGVAPLRPIAGLPDIEALAAAGPPAVEVTIPPGVGESVERMPRLVRNVLFRIAQEGVANARRHAAGATRITVAIDADAAGVELTIADDGAPLPSAPPAGFGIAGMTERAAMVGGTLVAGPAGSAVPARSAGGAGDRPAGGSAGAGERAVDDGGRRLVGAGWVVRAVVPAPGRQNGGPA